MPNHYDRAAIPGPDGLGMMMDAAQGANPQFEGGLAQMLAEYRLQMQTLQSAMQMSPQVADPRMFKGLAEQLSMEFMQKAKALTGRSISGLPQQISPQVNIPAPQMPRLR